eukprot:GHVN01042482.1.p1 GENE.GHVN01042482.1~~GHVN01042482.1.p1  ORF type:complete len:114 (+),score=31.37 GHVN01042482.1:77-418(+)
MSQTAVPEMETPVEATEAEVVKSDAAPQESQEESGDALPVTQEKPESTPVQSQQEPAAAEAVVEAESCEAEVEAVKRGAEELSQASQEEVASKKVRVLEGGDNPQSDLPTAEV